MAKFAIVTGAGGTLGLVFAQELAARGFRVALVDRSEAGLAASVAALTSAKLGSPADFPIVVTDLSLPGVRCPRRCQRWGVGIAYTTICTPYRFRVSSLTGCRVGIHQSSSCSGGRFLVSESDTRAACARTAQCAPLIHCSLHHL